MIFLPPWLALLPLSPTQLLRFLLGLLRALGLFACPSLLLRLPIVLVLSLLLAVSVRDALCLRLLLLLLCAEVRRHRIFFVQVVSFCLGVVGLGVV